MPAIYIFRAGLKAGNRGRCGWLGVSWVVLGNRRLMPAAGNDSSENNCGQQNAELTCIHNYLLKRNILKGPHAGLRSMFWVHLLEKKGKISSAILHSAPASSDCKSKVLES